MPVSDIFLFMCMTYVACVVSLENSTRATNLSKLQCFFKL